MGKLVGLDVGLDDGIRVGGEVGIAVGLKVVAVLVAVVVCVVLPHKPAPSGHILPLVKATQTPVAVLHGPTVPAAQSSQSIANELQSRYRSGHVRFSS